MSTKSDGVAKTQHLTNTKAWHVVESSDHGANEQVHVK